MEEVRSFPEVRPDLIRHLNNNGTTTANTNMTHSLQTQNHVEKENANENNNPNNNGNNNEQNNRKVKRNRSVMSSNGIFANVNVANLRKSFGEHDLNIDNLKSSLSKFDGKAKVVADKSETCKACGSAVFQMEAIKVTNGTYHKNCFKCYCGRPLSLEGHESNNGVLYCKPHFRELFQPKANFVDERIVRKVETIIRESVPVELPPDVVRATTEKSNDLEDLNLDLKAKFQLFESFKEQPKTEERSKEPIKRSSSVLNRLAKNGDVFGVTNEELSGDFRDGAGSQSSEEEENKEETMNNLNKKEILLEKKKAELNRFRTRLCMGKSSNLKHMFENICDTKEGGDEKQRKDLEEIEVKSGLIRDLFEKGQFETAGSKETKNFMQEIEEQKAGKLKDLFESIPFDESKDKEWKEIDDKDLFEEGLGKKSRDLFKRLDSGSGQTNGHSPGIKRDNSISTINKFGPKSPEVAGDVVRASERVTDPEIKTEDIASRFKFFEKFEERSQEKKPFRITPPRETSKEEEGNEFEAYRDPNVIRSEKGHKEELNITSTSKMRQLFRQMEQAKDEETNSPRPLKEFTPPREQKPEFEDDEEEEGEKIDETDNAAPRPDEKFDKEFLKEVGSLARARSLRAKFESWEADEERREKANGPDSTLSIDSARNLKAKFENYLSEEAEKAAAKPTVKVNRFVQPDAEMSENCSMCEKKVYVMEKVEAGGKTYHKTCFKCSQCKCTLRMDTFTTNKGVLFCTPHFKQLFKIKGNYDEGFGHETQKQIWMKKQLQKEKEGGE